jgi:hypothetical protein
MKKLLISIAPLLATSAAFAHEGHGLPGAAHWHATDVLGYVLIAVAASGAAWWSGRK